MLNLNFMRNNLNFVKQQAGAKGTSFDRELCTGINANRNNGKMKIPGMLNNFFKRRNNF
ncbi:MAG: hypothetical protein JSV88_10375 [Candidatus Aminicenantes bacterium]|nr:MAG: hypothetical protein JSV88_10375 [Candidatus Aminicenantes bacterium]